MLKVIELFAGIGGFRVGLERAGKKFEFVWANQWEPAKKNQIAWKCYEANFGKGSCVNQDIAQIDAASIPDFDLLTAGFPCQDYSVAKSLRLSQGIEGKKGVLWWEIFRILQVKLPTYVLLENVDRLIGSPAKQKGRDFAIILSCLMQLGYQVEWRIVNAAAFGFPQKRKRIFIFATRSDCSNLATLLRDTFPMTIESSKSFLLDSDIYRLSLLFGKKQEQNFLPYGKAVNFEITTCKGKDICSKPMAQLGDYLEPDAKIAPDFFIAETELPKWKELKLGRSIPRISKEGHAYIYKEGKMAFPDEVTKPARTIITGEGGSSPSRFKHIIQPNQQYRRLTPLELERLSMFPDNHTAVGTPVQRAFLIGNALVTGVVTEIGLRLSTVLKESCNP